MGNRGWSGSPPRDDADARDRIVAAATRCVQQFGPSKTSLTDVANALGITRQTVYRHFATTDELLNAAAVAEAATFLDDVAEHVSHSTDVVEVTVEMVAYTLESLPQQWFVARSLTRAAAAPVAVANARAMLERLPVTWTAHFDDAELDALAELLLRIIISFLHSPSDPPRTGDQLRGALRGWLTPVLTRPDRGHRRPT